MNSSLRACLLVALLGLARVVPEVRAEDMPFQVLVDWQFNSDRGWKALSVGQTKRAEQLFRKAIDILKPYAKQEQVLLARSYHDLAWTLHAEGRTADAEPLAKWALSVREKRPSDTKALAQNINTLAIIYLDQRRYSEAEPLYQRAVPLWEMVLGAEHPGTAAAHHDLAAVLSMQRKYDAAEPHFKRAIYIYDRLQNPDPNAVSSLPSTKGRGRADGSAPRPDPAALAGSLLGLSQNYLAQSRYTDAEPLLLQAIALYDSKTIPEEDLMLVMTIEAHVKLLRATHRIAEAASYESRANEIRKRLKLPLKTS